MEKDGLSGVPLAQCLELFKKKEKLEGYDCEMCKVRTIANIQPGISKLPDILIMHLKRFHFESGYLDKIEDLVTFPIKGLDMSRYLTDKPKQNCSYDLFGIVNHHMFQSQGGHYTAIIHKMLEQHKEGDPAWIMCND